MIDEEDVSADIDELEDEDADEDGERDFFGETEDPETI